MAHEREFATEVVRVLQTNGFPSLFAGGCVRDELLGIEPADFDIATAATPEQVKGLFRRCHGFGASFGVVEVLGPKDEHGDWLKVQVATFRSDGNYSDGRRPDSVRFSSPQEDAARRDFTINGLFFDPVSKEVYDYVGGEADLKAKVLRAIGDPVARFTEDKLRLLRAVRMAARFELEFDPATFEAAKRMAPEIKAVSAERIAEELRKMLVNRHRLRAVRLLEESGLKTKILPEATEPPSGFGSWSDPGFPQCLAALIDADEKACKAICKRFKLSNDETDRIVWLVGHRRSLANAEGLPKSRLYPLLVHPGIAELLPLIDPKDALFCEMTLAETLREVLDPPPLLTGDDLKALGYKPGPEFKTILERFRQQQLDEEVKTRAEVEEILRNSKPTTPS